MDKATHVCNLIDAFLVNNQELNDDTYNTLLQYKIKLLTYIDNKKILNKTCEEHYDICPWSNPEAEMGPDTCFCYYINRHINEVEKFIRNLEHEKIVKEDMKLEKHFKINCLNCHCKKLFDCFVQ